MSEPQPEQVQEGECLNSQKEAFAAAFGELIEPHAPALSEKFQAVGRWLEKSTVQAMPILQKLADVDWDGVKKRLEVLPRQSSEAMQIASRQGWFFNWQDSLKRTVQLTESLRAADSTDAIDCILMDHYNESWDGYVELLGNVFPARKVAIEAAVSAHRNFAPAGYTLSIPVFLAQADGIFSEVTGIPSAMDKVKFQKVIKGSEWVKEQIGDDQTAIDLLFPVLQLHELDILMSQRTRERASEQSGKVFDALNRHQVMHGEVSDYGTELNSMKAFSFLVFVALHIPDILESAKERSERQPSS